jgi:NAD(P)-dependent dehydrogenase (short-subunit alcohol dehydrogenase family)
MSSSSLTNFSFFLAVCGAATAYHSISKAVATAKKLTAKRPPPTKEDSKKKLVVISGCDRGFGYLLAEALLKETDYLVLALALTEKGVRALRSLDDDEAKTSPQLFASRCDVTSEDDVQRVGETVRRILVEQDAVLYSLVNNAGVASAGDFLFYGDISVYQKVMNVNFFGHLRMTQTLLPAMLETSRILTEHPRIINISSVCGVSASPSNSSYNASKFALEAWSDAIRLELEPFHIKVVKIRPGQIDTQIQKDWATTYLDNFAKAPPIIQELYGGHAFEESAKAALKVIGGGPKSAPEIVTDSLLNALTMRHDKLQPAYFVGTDAETLWRALGALPTSVSDSVKRLFRFEYPMTNEETSKPNIPLQ